MNTFWWIVNLILYFLGILAVLLTFLPFLRYSAWWIRIGEFPRLQIAAVCLLVIAFQPLLLSPLSMFELAYLFLLIGCSIYQIYCILPYLRFYPKQVEKSRVPIPQNVIRILISNVFIENRDTEKLVKLVKKTNPDLVLLSEPDGEWLEKIVEIEKQYPFTVKCPLDNAYGLALYSRLELVNPELKFLVEDDIPSIHTNVILPSGKSVRLYCLHPRPPVPTESLRSMERDAELLLVGREINKLDEPTIVCGDLNDVAWSWTTKLFQKISGLLDPRIGRGLYSTFPVAYPVVRCPLDHVFHSKHFRLAEIRRLSSINSDHYPMYISLSLEKTAEFTHEEPVAEPEEHEEAKEMIKEAFETLEEEKKQVRDEGLETA